MRTKTYFTVLLAALAGSAAAEIEVITRSLSKPEQYIVPSGRVLLIEHAQITAAGEDRRFRISPQFGTELTIKLPQATDTLYSFDPPFRVDSNWRVYPNAIGNTFVFVGLLIDKEDLFAGVSGRFDSFAAVEGGVGGSIRLDSARPALIGLERSADAASWEPETAAEVSRGVDPGTWDFTVPTAMEQKQFYRATARSRR